MSGTMTSADNFWFSMDDPVNLMVITGFMEFDEVLDYNRLYATIENRLAVFPRFQEKVVPSTTNLGVPKWEKDKNFDLRSHLHRVALPAPGDKNVLQTMMSGLKTKSLDYGKPLWDIHLIENYGKGCVLFFRLHHCIADGISLIYVLLSTADVKQDAPWPKKVDPEKNNKKSSLPLISFDAMINSAKGFLHTGAFAGKYLVNEFERCFADPEHLKRLLKTSVNVPTDIAAVLSKMSIMKSDPRTAFKGNLGVQKCVAWSEPMMLDSVKSVGKAISATTLNDVLIATVTGAMRRYLITRNSPVNELDLRVAIPVNIRKAGTEFELGNKFSLVFLALPVHLKDPVLRLKEVKRRMDILKKSPDAYVNFGLLSAIGLLPAGLAKRTAQIFGNKASGVLTNVPGPRQALYYAGKKISNMMFWVPQSGIIGLGISIFSYNGKVSIGITSDEGLMPDPEKLLEGFEDEFNELLELVHSGKIYDKPLVLHDRYKDELSLKAKKADNIKLDKAVPKSYEKCSALAKTGKRCGNIALPESNYCRVHQYCEQEEIVLKDVAQIMKGLMD